MALLYRIDSCTFICVFIPPCLTHSHPRPPSSKYDSEQKTKNCAQAEHATFSFPIPLFFLSLSLLWIDWTIKSWICVFHDEEMAHSICTAWDLIFSNVYWRSSTYNSSASMWMWSVFHLGIVDNKKVHYSECHEVPQH